MVVMVTLALAALDSVVDDQVVAVVPAAAAQLVVRVLLCRRLVLFVDHEWRVMVCGSNFFNFCIEIYIGTDMVKMVGPWLRDSICIAYSACTGQFGISPLF